jgi:hypothetical protein
MAPSALREVINPILHYVGVSKWDDTLCGHWKWVPGLRCAGFVIVTRSDVTNSRRVISILTPVVRYKTLHVSPIRLPFLFP